MRPKVEFDLLEFKNNIIKIKTQTRDINFLFPVKCCNYPVVLDIVNDNGFGFDISNKNEFKIIEKYLKKQFVSVSGPLSYELNDNNYDNLHIVSNNLSTFREGNGIRVNFNSDGAFDYSRFGMDYNLLDKKIKNNIEYIHFHNSDHRDLKKCESIYDEIKAIIKEFPNLKKINIGGHLEDLSFEEGIEYLNNVRNIVPENIIMFAELGDFLFKNVGTLYCNVVDVRYDNKVQIVTLNFSKMANQRWAYPKYISNNSEISNIKTIFYGCSCCETDTYLETYSNLLQVGDTIIFKNISPYSYQWNTSFNGVDKMEYVFKMDNES